MPLSPDDMAEKLWFHPGTARSFLPATHTKKGVATVAALALAIGTYGAKNPSEPANTGAQTPVQAAATSSPKATRDLLAPTVVDTARWQFTAGVQWRQIGSLSIRNGSTRSSDFLSLPQRSFYGEHEEGSYTDGYVLPDSANSGQTWNWGYDNASQLQGDTLSFSGFETRFDETVQVQRFNADWGSDLSGVGAFAELESPVLYKAKRFAFSVAGGYSFVQDSASHSAKAFTATHEINEVTENFTDAYDVSNLAAPPAAPYQGNFQGPGPLLNMSRTRSAAGADHFHSVDIYTSTLDQSFDLNLHTLSLGPRMSMAFGRVRAQLGVGFACNVADWEMQSTESLRSQHGPIKSWTDHAGGTEFLPGAYGELGLRWEFIRNWSINAAARYDYSQSLKAEAGPAAVELDLGGMTGSLGIGWNF